MTLKDWQRLLGPRSWLLHLGRSEWKTIEEHLPRLVTEGWLKLSGQYQNELSSEYIESLPSPKHALDKLWDKLQHCSTQDEREKVKSSIRELFAGDFWMCLRIYARSPTLEDNYDEEAARALYRLGIYLACFHWHQISGQLETIAAYRTSGRDVWNRMVRRAKELTSLAETQSHAEKIPADAPEFEAFEDILPTVVPDMFDVLKAELLDFKVKEQLYRAEEMQKGLMAWLIGEYSIEQCQLRGTHCKYTPVALAVELLKGEKAAASAIWAFHSEATAKYGRASFSEPFLNSLDALSKKYPRANPSDAPAAER
jgi:hypothetical protein